MFYQPERHIKHGDVKTTLSTSDYQVEGQMRIGGQEQFYMETCTCLVIPKKEDDEIEIIASTQNPTECQNFVSKALGVPANKIVVKLKRIGEKL